MSRARDEEQVPFLYQYPSAPPLPFTSSQNNRIVQPFEIASEVVHESFAVAETVPSVQQPSGSSVILNAGKTESQQLHSKIASGNADGHRLVYSDSTITAHSNFTGVSQHRQLHHKIQQSNADYVHELGARLPGEQPITATVCTSNSAAEEKLRNLEKSSEPAGYQFAEYTSTYEASGGYKYEDYKSIYDK